MKTKFLSIAFIAISFLFFNPKANAELRAPVIDTICCKPDSVKIISTNFPVFCVSWKVSADSSCKSPYGFTVQWRPFPGSGPWTEKIAVYGGGTTIYFCDSVPVCSGYQLRVRTICDSANTVYSDWVYSNKFYVCLQAKGAAYKTKDMEGSTDKNK